jgi:hypothetical protein
MKPSRIIGKGTLGMLIFVVTFVFLSSSVVYALMSNWAKTYGTGNFDTASSVCQTVDGGYIIAGYTTNPDTGKNDVLILKLDGDGNIQWQKTYGGIGDDVAYNIQQTSPDNGYIVVGITDSFGSGNYDAWVLKLYQNGNIQWQKTYGNNNADIAKSIQQTSNGGYIFAGESDYNDGYRKGWVVKIDSGGGIIWSKKYGGNGYYWFSSIRQTSDGKYAAVGGANMDNGDVWIVKLDGNGNIQAQRAYGGAASYDAGYDIQQTSDGGYIVVGRVEYSGNSEAIMFKLDGSGNIMWQKKYGGTGYDEAKSVIQTSDGDYIVVGKLFSSRTNWDAWALKLAGNGNILWNRIFLGCSTDTEDSLVSVQQTTDGRYIVAGGTESFGLGSYDAFILKIESNGDNCLRNVPDAMVYGPTGTPKFPSASALLSEDIQTVSTAVEGVSVDQYDICTRYSCVFLEGEWGQCGFQKCTFDSGSSTEFPILTRYSSSAPGIGYDPFGTEGDPHCEFPGCDTYINYKRYAWEITANYAPNKCDMYGVISYIESLGYKVDIYNDVGRVVTDGSNPHAQIVNNYRTGTGTSNVENTKNGLFYFIFPPNFNKTTDHLPILASGIGTGATPTNCMYGAYGATSATTCYQEIVKLIAQSKEDNGTGAIGILSMSGGEGSQGYDEESLDAFYDAIAFLSSYFNADTSKVVLFGGSRGGGFSLIRTAKPPTINYPSGGNYNVIAVFASAAPLALGSMSELRTPNSLSLDAFYPVYSGWKFYPVAGSDRNDDSGALGAWRYSSIYPPQDTAGNYVLQPLVGTTDPTQADNKSAIGYADYAHFGGKYIVLFNGTHDWTIPYHLSVKFDEALRTAGIAHKSIVMLKGQHGETNKLLYDEVENYVNNYLIKGLTPSNPDGRYYYVSGDLATHDYTKVIYLGSESGGIGLPFSAVVPAKVQKTVGGNNIYTGSQQPADIILVGTEGKTFKVQLLDSNHSLLNEWTGTFGTGTTGDEYHIIENISFGCTTAPCTYYWRFWYDGTEISPFNSPFLNIQGQPKEAYTTVTTDQIYFTDAELEMGGNSSLKLNMGITSLPSCGNFTCEQWENTLTCPEDCI